MEYTVNDIVNSFYELMPDTRVVEAIPISGSYSHSAWKVVTENAAYALKINVRKPSLNDFERELAAQKLAEQINVPKILAVSPTPNILGNPYYIQEWRDGSSAAEAMPEMTPEQKRLFGYEFGQAVGRMHQITFLNYSEDCIGGNPITSWQELCRTRLGILLEKNKTVGILPEAGLSNIEQKCERLLNELPIDLKPCFVHRDLYLNNVLINEGRFEAIIDFEGAKIYDSSWDFVKPEVWIFNEYPELRTPFYEGYESISPLISLSRFVFRYQRDWSIFLQSLISALHRITLRCLIIF